MKGHCYILIVFILFSCVKGDDFDTPEEKCDNTTVANKTVQEIFNV